MPPTNRACWLSRGAALVLLAAWLAACGGRSPGGDALHLTQAGFRMQAGAGWAPPPELPFSEHDGQDPPDVDDAGGGWTPVPLPHARPRSLAEGSASLQAGPEVAWYRLILPPDIPHEHAFLYLPRWQTIGIVAVYVDGRMTYRTRGSRVWNSFNRPLWLPLGNVDSSAPPRSVWVRMASQQGVGGALSSAWVGAEQSLLWRYNMRRFVQTELISHASAAFLVIGLFALGVGLVRRREPIYLLFFAVAATCVLRGLHYVVDDRPLPVPDDGFGWLTVNALGRSMAVT